jgi:putative ABC transport system periplasmic substrate-binding protein
MVNKINYTLVGLFFVVIVTIATSVMWWMSGRGKDSEYRSYYILTNELPSGIKKDSVVKFIGVDAGIVGNIEFSNEKEAIIQIELLVKKNLPIKNDSVAKAELQGITGLGYINISKGSNEAKVFNLNEKAYIKLEESALAAIGSKANDIGKKLEETLAGLNQILNNKNAKQISEILQNINTITSNLSSQNIDINQLLGNANSGLQKVEDSLKNFDNTLKNIDDLAKNSSKTMINFGLLSQQVLNKIQDGDYDIKDNLNVLTNGAEKTMSEMQKSLKEIRNTLFRLQDKPYEFFFKDPKESK